MPDNAPPVSEPCCAQFLEIARSFEWLHFSDWPEILAMPHIFVGDPDIAEPRQVRVNHCLSCGSRIRMNFYSRSLLYPLQPASLLDDRGFNTPVQPFPITNSVEKETDDLANEIDSLMDKSVQNNTRIEELREIVDVVNKQP